MQAPSEKREWIVFEKIGHLAIFSLNRPEALNTLHLEMVLSLKEKLAFSFKDPSISIILIQGLGEKAFCAGGDVKAIAQNFLKNPNSTYGDEFLEQEYGLDLLIHRSPKPLAVLAHGITMGGGIGLLAGADARILTESSLLAMPELLIGFFPDVGANFFLKRAPSLLGLFLALTGAKLSVQDALFAQLGNLFIPRRNIPELLLFFKQLPKNMTKSEFFQATQNYLTPWKPLGESALKPILPEIQSILKQRPLKAAHIQASEQFKLFSQALEIGCPESFEETLQHWDASQGLSLEECFEADLRLAKKMIRRPNFLEGVRARLIDKDYQPKWLPFNHMKHSINSQQV